MFLFILWAVYVDSSQIIAKVCDASTVDFYSSNRFMLVTFKSDGTSSGHGFRIGYKAILRSDVPSDWKNSPSDSSDSSVNVGGIVGGVISFLVIIAAFVMCCAAARWRAATSSRNAPYHGTPGLVIHQPGEQSLTPAAGGGGDRSLRNSHGNLAYSPTSVYNAPPSYTDLQFEDVPTSASNGNVNHNASPSAPPSMHYAGIRESDGVGATSHPPPSAPPPPSHPPRFESQSSVPMTPPPSYDDFMKISFPPAPPPFAPSTEGIPLTSEPSNASSHPPAGTTSDVTQV